MTRRRPLPEQLRRREAHNAAVKAFCRARGLELPAPWGKWRGGELIFQMHAARLLGRDPMQTFITVIYSPREEGGRLIGVVVEAAAVDAADLARLLEDELLGAPLV